MSKTIPASSGVWEQAVRPRLSGNAVKGSKQMMEMWGVCPRCSLGRGSEKASSGGDI